jgi:Domain of unknown function (DUF4373)
MGRVKLYTVDYFPHFCAKGKTKRILEKKLGNDGYAIYFKILEVLGGSEGHFYNCNRLLLWEDLIAYCNVEEDRLLKAIDLCVALEQFDRELWDNKVIWCQNFVDNLVPIYKKRLRQVPSKPTPIEAQEQSKLPFLPDDEKTKAYFKDLKVDESFIEPEKVKDILAKWNDFAEVNGLKRVKSIVGDRSRHLKARLEQGFNMDELIEAMNHQLRFLTGKTTRGWEVTFDWIIKNHLNYTKIIERKYENVGDNQPERAGSKNFDGFSGAKLKNFLGANRSGSGHDKGSTG